MTDSALAVLINSKAAHVIAEVLTHRVICIIDPPKFLIVDKGLAFTKVIYFILQTISFKLKISSPFNYKKFKNKKADRP